MPHTGQARKNELQTYLARTKVIYKTLKLKTFELKHISLGSSNGGGLITEKIKELHFTARTHGLSFRE